MSVRMVQQRLEIPHAIGQFHNLVLQEAAVSARGAAAVFRSREHVHYIGSMRSAGVVENRRRVARGTPAVVVSQYEDKSFANPCCLIRPASMVLFFGRKKKTLRK